MADWIIAVSLWIEVYYGWRGIGKCSGSISVFIVRDDGGKVQFNQFYIFFCYWKVVLIFKCFGFNCSPFYFIEFSRDLSYNSPIVW